MSEPKLVVRVSANMAELRKVMQETTAEFVTTKREMASMANAFDGAKIISQGSAVVAQIHAIGGVSKLTAAEQAQANRILDAALLKYHALGKEAPPGMQELASATRKAGDEARSASTKATGLTSTYKQFDGILQSLGINITKHVKGIEDATAAASNSASSFMKWGVAIGGAAAAFKVGWDFGTWISEVTGAGEAIEQLAKDLKIFGDESQTAAAKQDVINRAIENGADANITYAQAVEFNIKAAKDATNAAIDWTARMEEARAEIKTLTDAELEEIAVAKQLGATTDQLSASFNLSEDALRLVDGRLREVADSKKAAAAAAEDVDKATQKLTKSVSDNNKETVEAAESTDLWREANESLILSLEAREESMRRIAELGEMERQAQAAFMNAPTLNNRESQSFSGDIPRLTGFALDEVVQRFNRAGDQSPDQALWRALDSLEAMEGRRGKVSGNDDFFQRQRDAVLLAQLRQMLQGKQRPPGFKDGVENFNGGLAYVHRDEMLVNLPRGTDVIPAGAVGTSITIAPGAVVIQGSVVGGIDKLAAQIGAALMRNVRAQGFREPVGA